jgi:protein dithiol oxidoreductase (disulfide-forming)
VQLRQAWLLALLALGACGGPADPADTADLGVEPTDAALDALEPELVATDAAGSPTTGRFELGVHYLRLSPTQPTSSNPDQVEVAEIFWYGCPHCYELDPLLERWREQAPEYVNFVRVPAVWNPTLRIHARAFYTAEALEKGDEIHVESFREIHDRRNGLATEDALQEFFGRFDVDATAFKSAFDSFAVQAKLQRADELSRRYRIGSVPTIIVNGKYTTDGPMVGSYEALLQLVDELTAAEREAR